MLIFSPSFEPYSSWFPPLCHPLGRKISREKSGVDQEMGWGQTDIIRALHVKGIFLSFLKKKEVGLYG